MSQFKHVDDGIFISPNWDRRRPRRHLSSNADEDVGAPNRA